MVAERHRLAALQVGVAGHQRVRLGLREREGDERERVDLLASLRARVRDVQPQRGRDLVVPRATRVDLPPDGPSSRSIAEWTSSSSSRIAGRVERDLGEALLHLGELVRVSSPAPCSRPACSAVASQS